MGNLSPHFNSIEFACKCGCGYDDVHPQLIDLLEDMRNDIDEAVFIESGCRCQNHNTAEGGVTNSAHTKGMAADVRLGYMYGPQRYAVVRAAVRNNALGIGVAKTFIHVDVDESLPRPAVWSY